MKQAGKQKFTLNQPHPFLIKPNKKSCSNPRRSCFLTTTLSTLCSQFSYSANNPFTTSPCSDPSSPTLSSDTYPSSTKIPRHSGRRCPARPDGDIRPEAILSTSFGSLRTAIHRQVTCTCQIWIPGWILPHFDVRTISVASKLKKLQIFLYY